MSQELATVSASVIERTPDSEGLVREQFGLQEATTLEIEYLFAVAQRMGLDPVQKQIYGIMRWDKQAGRKKLTVQVGIDGYRAVAARTQAYAGSDDAVFVGDNGKGGPQKATVTVYKIVGGIRCPFTASARFEEYVQDFGQWPTKPYVMLAKCAEALALRKAFPAELGGTYTDAEMSSTSGEVQEVAGLTPEQASQLTELSKRAGVDDAVARVRIQNMRPSDFGRAVETLEQRIVEQESVAAAPSDEACEACGGSGIVEDEACGTCGGTGLAA